MLYFVRSQVRPYTPWFNAECRAGRRCCRCRKLERRYRRMKSRPFDLLRRTFRKHANFADKKNRYWTNRIADEKGCPGKLWRSVAKILRRNDPSTSAESEAPTADDFIKFFDDRVKSVRASTADIPSPKSFRTVDYGAPGLL